MLKIGRWIILDNNINVLRIKVLVLVWITMLWKGKQYALEKRDNYSMKLILELENN
jgi:hypothetical protein